MIQEKLSLSIITFFLLVVFCLGQNTTSTVEPPRTADLSFHPPIKMPAYPSGKGPLVQIDEARSLFLITDHKPDPAAIEKLVNSFGVQINNGYVLNGYFSGQEKPIVFKRANKSIAVSPITNGRDPSEKVNAIATFSGSAFKAGPEFQPVLILGQDKRSWIPKKLYDFHEDTPSISVSGWYQGACAEFGKGKIAFFSEAAMFTAQIFDQGKIRVGMNHPLAKDNAQLLLNVLHWLSGLL